MAKGSDNQFPSILVTEQASKPASPVAGDQRIYIKTDHKLYHVDSGGTETEVGAGSGGMAVDGWTACTGTWTYSSADAPTYIISVDNDQTGTIAIGQRIKLTHAAAAKYFIVTAVGAYGGGVTLITIYGGTDYTLAATAITLPYYSNVKAPLGFPLSPLKWQVLITDTANQSQTTPTASTWYNLGSLSISVPIGVWKLSYKIVTQAVYTNNTLGNYIALSTTNNSASDADLETLYYGYSYLMASIYIEKYLTVAAKTVYYLNSMTGESSVSGIYFRGDLGSTVIRALCAYL